MTTKYTVYATRYILRLQGDRVEDAADGSADEHGTHDTLEAAIAEAFDKAVKSHRGFIDYERETFGTLFDYLPEE